MARTTPASAPAGAPPERSGTLPALVAAGHVPVDARPLAAFNGWRLDGEVRGGHVPGAIALPAGWLRTAGEATIDEVLGRTGLADAPRVVVYGYGSSDVDPVAARIGGRRQADVRAVPGGWHEWAADRDLPVERLADHHGLVHPGWLRELIDGGAPDHAPAGAWRLFHVGYRTAASYADEHLPGAVHLDTTVLEDGRGGDIRSPAELEAALAAHGIDRDTTVVLYGRDTPMALGEHEPGRHAGRIAAMRAAFILTYAGVTDVRVLDGGYDAWVDAGGPVEAGPIAPTPLPTSGLDIPARADVLVERAEVEAMLADPDGAAVVSVRSLDEQQGRTSGYERIEAAGRIADDRWVDCGSDAWHMEAYRGPDNAMRPYPEIAATWADAGITPDKRVAFYCGTGWRASEAWFAAHLMGWSRIGLYDGGWFDWSGATGRGHGSEDRSMTERAPLQHWDRVYTKTSLERTGWYEADPAVSLELIERCGLAPDERIADIGSGASLLIDRLLERGHRDIVAVDISPIALDLLRDRLGDRAANVRFVTHDLGSDDPVPELTDIACWHDRAALHFLVDEDALAAYARTLRSAVRPGGFVILAAFALDGARMCSGLPVRNYDAAMLAELLGDDFEPLESRDHVHTNPRGEPRPYVYARFRRR